MQTSPSTRSSVLGKRAQRPELASSSSCEQLRTPDATPNPKRARVSLSALDGVGNKENVPPLKLTALNGGDASPILARANRALRRNATDAALVTPPRPRPSLKRRASVSASSVTDPSIATPPPTPTIRLSFHARARALLRATCDDMNVMPGRDTERDIISNFISAFISGISKEACQSLYISGSPGSGKTALVNSVLYSLEGSLGDTKVVHVNCMALNSIDSLWDRIREELQQVTHIQKKRKVGSRAGKLKGREAVENLLSGIRTKCIVVLDELDHVASNSQSVTSLLALSESQSVCVIGIANTHTLTTPTSSLVSSSHIRTVHFAPYTPVQLLQILHSRLAPLSDSELAATDDINAMKKFLSVPTLALLTKKVAALTGDVRTLLEVLRGSIDLAVASSSSSLDSSAPSSVTDSLNGTQDTVPDEPAYKVTPAHVLAALKAYSPSGKQPHGARSSPTSSSSAPTTPRSNSETVTKIRSLGFQPRLALLALLLVSKRIEAGLSPSSNSSSPTSSPIKRTHSALQFNFGLTGKAAGFDMNQLHAYYSGMLRRASDGVAVCAPVSRSEFNDLAGMLEGMGLISVGCISSSLTSSPTKKKKFGRSASFGQVGGAASAGEVKLAPGVWADEVLRGLGVMTDPVSSDVSQPCDIKEEEVRAIWRWEETRIAKEVKARDSRAKEASTAAGTFLDALED